MQLKYGLSGMRKQRLFDRRFIESSSGVQLTVNPPLQCTPINLPLLPGHHARHFVSVLDVDDRLWRYYHLRPDETRERDCVNNKCCRALSSVTR